MSIHTRRQNCRVCGGKELTSLINFGLLPLANSFLSSPAEFIDEPRFPLEVFYCHKCSLVQLLDVIDPQALFQNYIYVTGTSETIAAHNKVYAQMVVNRMQLKKGDLVIEVASNDGSLLKCFQSLGIDVLGIEPASNIARIANENGVTTENLFFNNKNSETISQKYGCAKAVIGNNVLAHVDDPVDFLRGCKSLIAQDGLVMIEVPYLLDLIDHLEYDTIYHEHLSYFSITSLSWLFEMAGLSIVEIETISIHGGSIRIIAADRSSHGRHARPVLDMVEKEHRIGLQGLDFYIKFSEKVMANREQLLELLNSIYDQKKSIAGYGAPAKGNTLLNYCGISTDLLPYTVDKNIMKVGKFTPGMQIPVLPVETLLQRQPDYVMILAWNFAEEIMQQQELYRQRGGSFIIPIPHPRIVL